MAQAPRQAGKRCISARRRCLRGTVRMLVAVAVEQGDGSLSTWAEPRDGASRRWSPWIATVTRSRRTLRRRSGRASACFTILTLPVNFSPLMSAARGFGLGDGNVWNVRASAVAAGPRPQAAYARFGRSRRPDVGDDAMTCTAPPAGPLREWPAGRFTAWIQLAEPRNETTGHGLKLAPQPRRRPFEDHVETTNRPVQK